MQIKSYKDLVVWQKSVELCQLIYKTTEKFPKEEVFGLTSQTRRSAVSISSNIAEGRSRNTRKDFVHFLYISLGSCAELETQIEISKKLGFLDKQSLTKIDIMIGEISKMLKAMIAKLKANS